MYTDPSGHAISALLAGAFFGFVISFTNSVATQILKTNGNLKDVDLVEAAYDGAFGAINGMFAASGINLITSGLLGATFGGISSLGKELLFDTDGKINTEKIGLDIILGFISGLIAGAGADNVALGAHVTKFINSKNILNKTIINGTKSAILRQTAAKSVHSTQLAKSGARYLMSVVFSTIVPETPIYELFGG